MNDYVIFFLKIFFWKKWLCNYLFFIFWWLFFFSLGINSSLKKWNKRWKIHIYPSHAQLSTSSYTLKHFRFHSPKHRKRRIFTKQKIRVSNRCDGTVRTSQIRDLSLQQIGASFFSEIHSSTLSHCSFHFSGQ